MAATVPPGFETPPPNWSVPAKQKQLPALAPEVGDKPSVLDRDPGAVVATIQGIVLATLAVLTGFGIVHWTTEQQGLVWALVLALLGGVQLIIGRGRAWAPTTVSRLYRQTKEGQA